MAHRLDLPGLCSILKARTKCVGKWRGEGSNS